MSSNAPEKPKEEAVPPGAYPQPVYPPQPNQQAPMATGQPIFTQQPYGAPPAHNPHHQFQHSPTFSSPPAVAGMKVGPPRSIPQPGMVIIGWEVWPPSEDVGCCKCETLSPTGWIIVILLAIIFWPLAFIPCLMDSCHEPQQRPIYGYPDQPSGGYSSPPPPPPAGAAPPAMAP